MSALQSRINRERWKDPEYRRHMVDDVCGRHLRKLTNEEASDIKAMLRRGFTCTEIQRVYDHISVSCIRFIKTGRTYKDCP